MPWKEDFPGSQSLIKEPEITSEVEKAFKNYNFYKSRKKREDKKPERLSIDLGKVATTGNRSPGPELVAENGWNRLSMDSMQALRPGQGELQKLLSLPG